MHRTPLPETSLDKQSAYSFNKYVLKCWETIDLNLKSWL